MLGDSIRRRRPKPKRQREAEDRPPRRSRPKLRRPRGLLGWLGLAVAVSVASFGIGWLLSVFVLFPAPADAGLGVAAPDVRRMPLAEAEAQLRSAGLATSEALRLASREAAGDVIAQDPLPGQHVRPGAPVRLVVSDGPAHPRVPPLRGMDAEQATALLQHLDVDVSRRDEMSVLAAGLVVRTTPPEGSELDPPPSVLLVVSSGPPPPLEPSAVDSLGIIPPAAGTGRERP